jgi:hypothetical protein
MPDSSSSYAKYSSEGDAEKNTSGSAGTLLIVGLTTIRKALYSSENTGLLNR